MLEETELEEVLESTLESVIVLVVQEEVSREIPGPALNSDPSAGQLAHQEEKEDQVSDGEEHVYLYMSKELEPSIEQVGLERPLRFAIWSLKGVDRRELRGVERREKCTCA